ncbi:MAG: 30S ribosomal protein S6 [Chloroflexi bacterium]|nr:30S ribosomal protein S6 [Chloroflexota bacterium]
MKRSYEITYIVTPNLGEEDQKAVEDRVVGWIDSAGGEIKNSSHWGRRRLAYPIAQNREGYYIFLEADLEPDQVGEFERRMAIDVNIIRHLLVRAEE